MGLDAFWTFHFILCRSCQHHPAAGHTPAALGECVWKVCRQTSHPAQGWFCSHPAHVGNYQRLDRHSFHIVLKQKHYCLHTNMVWNTHQIPWFKTCWEKSWPCTFSKRVLHSGQSLPVFQVFPYGLLRSILPHIGGIPPKKKVSKQGMLFLKELETTKHPLPPSYL